jgi:hypothetical protein
MARFQGLFIKKMLSSNASGNRLQIHLRFCQPFLSCPQSAHCQCLEQAVIGKSCFR